MKPARNQIESLAFRLQHAPGVGAATLRSILRRIQQERLDASAFLSLEDRELQGRFKMKSEACEFLRQEDDLLDAKWLQLENMGVHMLVNGQPGYPERLGRILGSSAAEIKSRIDDLAFDLYSIRDNDREQIGWGSCRVVGTVP